MRVEMTCIKCGVHLDDEEVMDISLSESLGEANIDRENNAAICARLLVLHGGMPERLEKIVTSILARRSQADANDAFDFFWGFLHEDGLKRIDELSAKFDELLPEAISWVTSVEKHGLTTNGGE